jgi:hypothetical protein
MTDWHGSFLVGFSDRMLGAFKALGQFRVLGGVAGNSPNVIYRGLVTFCREAEMNWAHNRGGDIHWTLGCSACFMVSGDVAVG